MTQVVITRKMPIFWACYFTYPLIKIILSPVTAHKARFKIYLTILTYPRLSCLNYLVCIPTIIYVFAFLCLSIKKTIPHPHRQYTTLYLKITI